MPFPHKHIVSEEYRFIYSVLQKVACTSIKTALLRLFEVDTTPYEFRRQDGSKGLRIHRLFTDSPYEVHQAALKRKLQNNCYDNYFKFAFVRNPYHRLLSCYVDKIASGRGFEREEYAGVRLKPKIPFGDFVRAVDKIPDEEANGHFRSQYTTLYPDGTLLPDFVGRFENLAEDFAYVARKIDAPEMSLPHLMKSDRQVKKTLSTFYDEELKRIVHRRYEADLELFGYDFPKEG